MNEVGAPDALVATATDVSARRDLAALYADALQANLAKKSESTLRRAYEIGRHGFAGGLGVLVLASMHHEALARIATPGPASAPLPEQIVRAGEFFAESLSTYEMAHRGFR